MDHRKEIDGLRAVAVLAVVFCHAGFPLFGGGFVGVDIFFVISGYLITSIILRELAGGKFSLSGFYERRARRILPALYLVILLSLPAAWLWLWPEDFRNFAKSLGYVVSFASNVHFYREIGYFEPDVELRPLLHTWSLGVEEQYYILFPLIMLLCWRFGSRYLLLVLSLAAALSFGVAQYGLERFPEASFYLLPSRAWELLVGAIYATVSQRRHPLLHASFWLRNFVAISGLLFILVAIFLYSPATPFPGGAALLPVFGAVLVIAAATSDTLAGKILTQRAMLAIGLWSYSIYLWHQPIFAFVRYHDDNPSSFLMGGMIVLILALSFISWRYVEVPFRQVGPSGKRLLAFAVGGVFFFLCLGLVGKHRGDFVKRYSPGYTTQVEVEKALQRNFGLARECNKLDAGPICQTDPQPEVLIWGDSYAMHLVDGFIADAPGLKMIQRSSSGCGPIIGLAPIFDGDLSEAKACLDFNEGVFARIKSMPSLRFVVMSSPFVQYFPRKQDGWGGQRMVLTREGVLEADISVLFKNFLQTVEQLRAAGLEPIVVAPPPASGMDIGKCLARSVLLQKNKDRCDFPLSELIEERRQVYDFLESFGDKLSVVWLHRDMCREEVCRTHIGEVFLYLDSGHLSRQGSAMLGRNYGWSSRLKLEH